MSPSYLLTQTLKSVIDAETDQNRRFGRSVVHVVVNRNAYLLLVDEVQRESVWVRSICSIGGPDCWGERDLGRIGNARVHLLKADEDRPIVRVVARDEEAALGAAYSASSGGA